MAKEIEPGSGPGISAANWARGTLLRNRQGQRLGIFSVCSASKWVLETAIQQAIHENSCVVVESTSNQVNQFGGYTWLTPSQFQGELRSLARHAGLPENRVLIGGDHLGPYPWRHLPAAKAMENACQLVRDCVSAGYKKIHLDTSMACADDPTIVSEEVVAHRAAMLAQEAEKAWQVLGDEEAPIYVVGTEVPSPGGEKAGDTIRATAASAVAHTLEVARNAFRAARLESAWDRVVALVVQPGVDFSQDTIVDYDREKARELTRQLMTYPGIVYEAHSTDYQAASSLARLAEDHFAVLKVGPWLTFKMREAIFALSEIEKNWLGTRKGIRLSNVRGALEDVMLKNPGHWRAFYSGDNSMQYFLRAFGFSDRCRYYWGDATVQSELNQLLQNLATSEPPLPVLSQFLPAQYEKVRNGSLSATPRALISDHIGSVLRIYRDATTGRRDI